MSLCTWARPQAIIDFDPATQVDWNGGVIDLAPKRLQGVLSVAADGMPRFLRRASRRTESSDDLAALMP
jgi:hypothetical protein